MNPKLATTIYDKDILDKYYENSNEAYWEDPANYTTQNWSWLGTALYNNTLNNFTTANK